MLEITKDSTGFRFNLTDASKTKGLTAFKANGVDVDFTIEGFHNIINDKFTLSNTYDTTATGTLTQDEINWIDANSKDILALILDIKRSGSGTDIVTRSEYNDLLNAYNDLAERLNIFLQNTGNMPTLSANQLKTKSLNAIEIQIKAQHATNDYTIDWGDGNTSQSGNADTSTLTHNYSETGVYIITVTPNNNNAAGNFIANDYFTEVNIKDFQFSPAFDNYLVKGTFDNQILTLGSGSPFISNCSALEEVHIKENCYGLTDIDNCNFIDICPDLTKLTIDNIIDFTNAADPCTLITQCDNIEELHLTNLTPPTLRAGDKLFDIVPQNLTIYVPNALLNDYKTALPDYINYIVGE